MYYRSINLRQERRKEIINKSKKYKYYDIVISKINATKV